MLALITATRNSMDTLPDTLASVEPLRARVKQFFVDGASTDGTREYLQNIADNSRDVVVQPQLGTGLYEALNQGLDAAISDPDVTYIGMLHSDDRLITKNFERFLVEVESGAARVLYSDIRFHNSSNKVVRIWKSSNYSRFKLITGWMPPHTSMVVDKSVYRDIGLYRVDFGTAADYEWIVRVLTKFGSGARYFPEATLSMLVGGASGSSLKARLRANKMDGEVWSKQSILHSIAVRICKPARKLGQFFLR